MLRHNAIFTNQFFVTPILSEDEKKLIGLVPSENPEDLPRFFHSEEGKQFRAELKELMEFLERWVVTNLGDMKHEDVRHKFEAFNTIYIEYYGNNPAENKRRIPLYRDGISNLRKLVALLKASNASNPVPDMTKEISVF